MASVESRSGASRGGVDICVCCTEEGSIVIGIFPWVLDTLLYRVELDEGCLFRKRKGQGDEVNVQPPALLRMV